MSCENPLERKMVRVFGAAKVGLCPDFRKKWESLKIGKERNDFLNGLIIKKDYFDIHNKYAFSVDADIGFIDINTEIKDPVLIGEMKDMATLLVTARYDACHPDFKDLDKDDAINSILYEWLFDDLSDYVCSLRQVKPYQSGLVVSRKKKSK